MRIVLCLVMFAASAVATQAQASFTDGVLSSSSDLTNDCANPPAPAPQLPMPGVPRSTPPPPAGCSDLGSSYTVKSGGHLYGIQRTASDVRRESALLSLGNTPSSASGVLASRPTGTHVMVSVQGRVMHVRLAGRDCLYTVVFTR